MRRSWRSVSRGAILAIILAATTGTTLAQEKAASLLSVDIRLPSQSTGVEGGTLAVRVYHPVPGHERYAGGAPVLIWVHGGFEVTGVDHGLPPEADDLICVTFVYPGGEDPFAGVASDGVYDYRGEACIAALRDVILFASGAVRDADGRTIDEVVPAAVLHDNVGLIGESNGGNILTAVAALYGEELTGHLRYLIQWETPVSSQIATRDLGRVWLKPGTGQGDYWNLRYLGYDPLVLPVDYSDLAFDPTQEIYPVFHDGNGDGRYTTVPDPNRDVEIPDLNRDGMLSLDEDFPLDTYPVDDDRVTYSRPVMHELAARDLFSGRWPDDLVSVAESDAYWNLRESVRLTEQALSRLPDLEAMVLCNVRDHVQAMPGKPHVRQAFDSWNRFGGWVKLNPSAENVAAVDPSFAERHLPDLAPNQAPVDWTAYPTYAMPADLPKPIYELAAIYEMADRISPPLSSNSSGRPDDRAPTETITYVASDGNGRIAIAVREPAEGRFPEGAPVVVNVSGFFTSSSGFDFQLDANALGAIYVTYLWPGRDDARTGAHSEGSFDYGGARCLAALRDVIRFATGEAPDVAGRFLHDIVQVPVHYDVAGIYAFSHSGIAATNVLARYGSALQRVRFFVGRENPTIDALYPLEPGYWSDETGLPVYNPFYDPSGYTPSSISIDYSTAYWSDELGRPAFAVADGPDFVCSSKHPQMWGKDYWSTDLLQALLDNGALTRETWPSTLALPEEAAAYWPSRTTVRSYAAVGLSLPDLKVMLVFAADDHVQTAIDKPHIHQAYDGFHEAARLWCRLNPDRAYVEAFASEALEGLVPEHPANREPATWMIIRSWGYRTPPAANLNVLVPLASVAEMLDRTYYDVWQADLDRVLGTGPSAGET
jgi:hypothetical protein